MTRSLLLSAVCAIALAAFAPAASAATAPSFPAHPAAPAQACDGGRWLTLHEFTGETNFGHLGSAVANAGLVDGDTVPDILVGAMGDVAANLYSGADGSLIHRFSINATAMADYGGEVAGLGDVNGDGTPDVAVGASGEENASGLEVGGVYVYSGATGALLHHVQGPNAQSLFGRTVTGVGDLNGDGLRDFVVGAPYATGGAFADAGAVFVHSGATGARLRRIDGWMAGQHLGATVVEAGDLDGNGSPDLWVSAPWIDLGGIRDIGAVYAVAPATGTRLWTRMAPREGTSFGASMDAAGDLDGDGTPDVIVGAPFAGAWSGAFAVLSGATGTPILEVQYDKENERFGTSVAGVGDLDGDGVPDLAAGSHLAGGVFGAPSGSVFVYSGANGALIHRIRGEPHVRFFGNSIAGAGDLSGEGTPDLLVGAEGNGPYTSEGKGYVFALDPFLRTNFPSVSASFGGTIQFRMDFPVSEAGRPYALRGSASGRDPVRVGGMCIPFTPDALTQLMVTGNAPGFTNTNGSLDAQGRAVVVLDVPPNTPALRPFIGTTLWFAAYTTDAQGNVREISVAVPLDVVP